MSIAQAKTFLNACNERHHDAGPFGDPGVDPVTLDDVMAALIGVGYAVVAVAEQLEKP